MSVQPLGPNINYYKCTSASVLQIFSPIAVAINRVFCN